MLRLKNVLQSCNVRQADMARCIVLSQATVAQMINHNIWPRSISREELQLRITAYLESIGAPLAAIATAFDEVEVDGQCSNTARRPIVKPQQEEEDYMLLRKQGLLPNTKRHFGLFRDPFPEEVRDHDDVFISPDIRYVREAMYQAARHGGFLAVVGESGAGKSTLRRDLIDRIQRDGHDIVVIEPYVLAMEDNDQKGKTLKAGSIADAIISTVSPLASTRRSQDAKFRQMHSILRDSSRAGVSHVLVIEEAHGLPLPTLKHLKRFYELEDGFKKLLSIILIGQPELRMKLSERNHEVREVVQRCEVIELPALDARLGDYLKFKLERVGKAYGDVFDTDAADAITAKLSFMRGGKDRQSLLYPLATNNLVLGAMNLAAELGAPKVTGDIVKAV